MNKFPNSEMTTADRQIGTIFSALGPIARDGKGSYIYQPENEQLLNDVFCDLIVQHGLAHEQIMSRLLIASELAVTVREHLAPLASNDETHRWN